MTRELGTLLDVPEGADMAAFWAARHTTTIDWPGRYWRSWNAPHRARLEAEWTGCRPAPTRVLEIGAAAGPNLRRAALRWPSARLVAVDINAVGLEYLERMAAEDGWRERLETIAGDMRRVLPTLPDGFADLTVSCYALAYLPPADVPWAVAELRRLTRRLAIVMEPLATGASRWIAEVTPPGWAHDWVAAIGPDRGRVTCTPYDGPDSLNGVIRWEVA